MANKEIKSLLDEIKDSLERAREVGLEALAEAEKEINRFFEPGPKADEESPGAATAGTEAAEGPASQKGSVEDATNEAADRVADRIDEVIAEAKTVFEEARVRVEQRWEEIEERIRAIVESTGESLGKSSRERLERLEKRVTELEAALAALASEPPAASRVEVRPVGGGWYEIVVDGQVMEKVHGKEAAEESSARYAG